MNDCKELQERKRILDMITKEDKITNLTGEQRRVLRINIEIFFNYTRNNFETWRRESSSVNEILLNDSGIFTNDLSSFIGSVIGYGKIDAFIKEFADSAKTNL